VILGLTGKFAAGKGTVAEHLTGLGYRYHSLSDILREDLAAGGIPEGRDALREIGNALRQAGGPGVLATRLLERLRQSGDHIVDSIRNPAEVTELRALPDFALIAVDAPAEVRFARLRSRDRAGDPQTWEAFQAMEEAELVSDDPTTQQLLATLALADHGLDNGGGLDALTTDLQALLREIAAGMTA
jgi:dCMP deaminase